MMRISAFLVVFFTLAFVAVLQARCPVSTSSLETDFDGAYIFVSETTSTSKPTVLTLTRKPPTWKGLYIFQKGVFSRSLVNTDRKDDFTKFPANFDELGYESTAGCYTLSDSELWLTANMSLDPFGYRRSTKLIIEKKGSRLILRQKLSPHIEDLRSGEIVTVLEKVAPGSVDQL